MSRRSAPRVLRAGWVRQTLGGAILVAAVLAAVRAPAPLGPAARRAVAWGLGTDVAMAAVRRQLTRIGAGLGLTAGPRVTPAAPGTSSPPPAGAVLPTPMGRLITPAMAPVSAWFGWREVAGRPRFNSGLDLSTATGTAVRAVATGTVRRLSPSIVLGHADGWQSVYGRCAASGLHVGQVVRQGTVICRTRAGGLIFQLLVDGRPIDPAPYLGLKAPARG